MELRYYSKYKLRFFSAFLPLPLPLYFYFFPFLFILLTGYAESLENIYKTNEKLVEVEEAVQDQREGR
jgi:hypothetical protein